MFLLKKRLSATGYLLLVLALSLPFLFTKAASVFHATLSCSAAGYTADTYMAYCENDGFGDYEHGALFFELEPESTRNLERAEILFLGNSRTQVAFSSPEVRRFMDAHGWRSFALGFGYGETSVFAAALLRQERLRPKVVIINADPFFSQTKSGVADALLTPVNRAGERLLYEIKKLAQRFHRFACTHGVTCGEAPTIFRSRRDGSWDVRAYLDAKRLPVVTPADRLLEEAPQTIAAAKGFLRDTGIAADCTILTVIPSNFSTARLAEAVAAATAMPFVAPDVGPLFTTDSSHLDPDSSARWTHAFLEQARPLLARCLGD